MPRQPASPSASISDRGAATSARNATKKYNNNNNNNNPNSNTARNARAPQPPQQATSSSLSSPRGSPRAGGAAAATSSTSPAAPSSLPSIHHSPNTVVSPKNQRQTQHPTQNQTQTQHRPHRQQQQQQHSPPAPPSVATTTSCTEEEYDSNQSSSNAVAPESRIPTVKSLIAAHQYSNAVELLDLAIGSPTYADLPMFDESHPDPPDYDERTLLELLALRIECWMNLSQFGRAIEDISSAMKTDLQSASVRKEFVIPKLKALYDLGDVHIGLQVANALEVAVARNTLLLEAVTEWKRKFVLLARKKNEVASAHIDSSQHTTIVIGSRRIAAGAPGCRHGCPDREPASFFQMEIVVADMQIQDGFQSLFRLFSEYEGPKLPWKHWARQQLREAIDAAASENWKACRDATRQYLLAQEFVKNGNEFVDAMDTLGRVPNPVHCETHHFFRFYDRSMSTIDHLVELLCELSKPYCSCMSEISELRKRRVKNEQLKNNNASASSSPRHHRGAIPVAGGGAASSGNNNNNATSNSGSNNLDGSGDDVNMSSIPSITVSRAIMREKEAIRESHTLKEEGNLLFLARKFRSALQKYDEAIALDPDNSDLFFNRTAALFELEHYDAVIMACDKAMEHAIERNKSDRSIISKILARRGDALEKMGALEEALIVYQESCDSVESSRVRLKIAECEIAIQKRNHQHNNQNGTQNENNNDDNNQQQNIQQEEKNITQFDLLNSTNNKINSLFFLPQVQNIK